MMPKTRQPRKLFRSAGGRYWTPNAHFRSDDNPIPAVIEVPVAEIRKHLPPEIAHVTLQERERALRDRRSALQQRRLW